MDFATMMNLESHGPDTFVGIGPKYPWGGLYGGQIVAQALRAATLTVEPEFRVHSLHAYFIRRGDHAEPIRFEVDRIRNGRSFVTRSVIARQSIGAILNMSASFQVDEPAPDMQIAVPPDVALPEPQESQRWMSMFERYFAPRGAGKGRAVGWLRMLDEVGDDPALHACALAYMSDDLPTDAVVALQYPDRKPGEWDGEHPFWTASLDHAVWFHRPVRADEWQLQDFTCHGLISSRGLSVGHVFDTNGVHLATISQEVLLRELRPEA
ncbi:MAG TPA: acyl-CoA thioesterase domain-containing protein [Acidimicrobiales bacterium]|nr:acyl-CoA thioesterase domain-containing protein [Acidimicrobiales bacterium]